MDCCATRRGHRANPLIAAETVAHAIALTCGGPTARKTHWTGRAMANIASSARPSIPWCSRISAAAKRSVFNALVFCRENLELVRAGAALLHPRRALCYMPAMHQHRNLARTIAQAASVALVLAWFGTGFLENAWVSGPRGPNLATRQTLPYELKGITVYITEWNKRELDMLQIFMIISGAIAAVGWGLSITYFDRNK
jgi:hypothetical protein